MIEKEFVKRVNIDKAKNKTVIPIFLTIISLLTYIFPLILGDFDFGIIFEVLTLVFTIIARTYMNNYKIVGAKVFTILAMIPIGWILIYDFITMITTASDAMDFAMLGIDYYVGEVLTILELVALFRINIDLAKAENPEKYKESTDWFYEKYEEDIKN